MTWKRSVLVLANLTAASEELYDVLRSQAENQPTRFTLIIPASPLGHERQEAHDKLAAALEGLRGAGLDVDGHVGDCDPLVAVSEAWDPKRYDEIVVSTLPTGVSKWLHAGLPERVEKLTGAPVTHVEARPPAPSPQHEPAPHHDDKGPLLGPLSVLRWGAKDEHE